MDDTATLQIHKTRARTDIAIGAGLGLIALIVYLTTLTPSLSSLSPDGSELATIPALLGLAHSPGYPLYTWLGYLFSLVPVGDVAFRINMMSAFMGALGVGGLFIIIMRLLPEQFLSNGVCINPKLAYTLNRGVAGLLVLIFAFSPTFWSQCLIAEVYAVNTGMLALTLWALLRWEKRRKALDFFLFALLFGLSLGTHISNLGFAPGFVVFILLVSWRVLINWRWWIAALTGFGLGVLQYAWLPFKANTLNDQMMLGRAPSTLQGIYSYTLDAFSNLKFAFSLGQLPERLVLYFFMAAEELGWITLFLGIVGLFSILFRKPKHYFLLVLMYLVHVWFFIQYRVFDLEVFFIPSHLIWAIFAAFGLREIISIFAAIIKTFLIKGKTDFFAAWGRPLQRVFFAGLILLFLVPAVVPLVSNWSQNDLSEDTAINDFYSSIWTMLPADTVLLTQSGVFGYQAFYWQLIYDVRPDVTLPAISTPNPDPQELQDKAIYSTLQGTVQRGPGTLPENILRQVNVQVPILFGENNTARRFGSSQLILYENMAELPELVTTDTPDILINQKIGSVTLLGVDVLSSGVENGTPMELSLYWQIDEISQDIARYNVQPGLNEETVTSMTVGLGLLTQYNQQNNIKPGDVISDHFYMVIPSRFDEGTYTLTLQVTTPAGAVEMIEITEIEILDEVERLDTWLQTAGLSY